MESVLKRTVVAHFTALWCHVHGGTDRTVMADNVHRMTCSGHVTQFRLLRIVSHFTFK